MPDLRITAECCAKINLYLHVLPRGSDGMHPLISVMQSVGLCDTLTLFRSSETHILCDDNSLCGENSIIIKAGNAFFEYTGLAPFHYTVELNKNIPVAAGLAGGSADAAGMLLALDMLCASKLTEYELIKIGRRVGSDVPFCLVGGTALVKGTGEEIFPLPPLRPDFRIVICSHGKKASTALAYAELDSLERRFDSTPEPPDTNLLQYVSDGLFNDFELLNYPNLGSTKAKMREFGAKGCLLSGSGPSVFGIFESSEAAEACTAQLNRDFAPAFCVAPTCRGVTLH